MTLIEILAFVVSGLIVLFALELFVVAFVIRLNVPGQRIEHIRERPRDATEKGSPGRKDVSFPVDGTTVRGWLYLPEKATSPVPCIVMAHGLGGTKDLGLDLYASRFQKEGFAVLAFDYRHYGSSDGEPRQLVWIPSQLEDYRNAIEHARSLAAIDPERIALWGTSLSGGHVIVVAAHDHRIACVAAQVPWLDGTIGIEETIKREGFSRLFRMVPHGQRDYVRSWFGLSPHRIPLVGKPGSIAVMADQEAWDSFAQLATEGFVNEVCARILIRMDKYRPIGHLKKARCPILVQLSDKDFPLSRKFLERIEKGVGSRGRVVRYPIRHFDIYSGDPLERSVSDQITFFKKHLV